MKVVRIDDEDTKLTKKQERKVAILKLTENGKYIEGVGIKDDQFFLLTEGDDDEIYLAYMHLGRKPTNLTLDKTVQTVLLIMKEREIRAVKAELLGKEPPQW